MAETACDIKCPQNEGKHLAALLLKNNDTEKHSSISFT